MFLALELGVALAILAQLSAGQSMVSSVYYQKISIEASSWSDIRAHTLKGLEREITCFLQVIFQKEKKYYYRRSARIQCAAICTANPNCVAYYYKSSECHEANGIGLTGALPDSPTALAVFIDSSLDPGKIQHN